MPYSAPQSTEENPYEGLCPVCASPLTEVQTTKAGKRYIRCTLGGWNAELKQPEGCEYIKWLDEKPKTLKESCPKCGNALMMATTKSGKKLKKCSTAGWDREKQKATGCTFVEWVDENRTVLKEGCPTCGQPLVLQKTSTGKRLKKCSTARWDRDKKESIGCTYVEWINDDDKPRKSTVKSRSTARAAINGMQGGIGPDEEENPFD